jgi:hypothetical protein
MTPKTFEQVELMERLKVEEYMRLMRAGAEDERLNALRGPMNASELSFLADRLTRGRKPLESKFVAKAAAVLVGYWMTYWFVVHVARLAIRFASSIIGRISTFMRRSMRKPSKASGLS